MRWTQPVQYGSMSDVGFRRQNNQDANIVQICSNEQTWSQFGHLFLVADGMGGHAVGELASKIAVDTVPHSFFKSKLGSVGSALKAAVEAANGAIHERGTANHDFQRMGTTCTALVLSKQGAIVGHVGDSRCYRVRSERIDQLTFDHSLQWEMLRHAKMKQEEVLLKEPRNVITRSLGPESTVQVDIEGPHPILPGDVYVLCSDGLTTHVSDAEIGAIAGELPPPEACRLLVNLANVRGGSDNITVVIAKVGALSKNTPVVEEDVVDTSAPDEHGIHWWWLAAFWAVAITLVTGFSFSLLRWSAPALLLTLLGVAAAIVLIVGWFRHRPVEEAQAAAEREAADLSQTMVWRPYRTASARLDERFLGHLAAIEAELQRTAADEEWKLDWDRHESLFERARTALGERNFAQAIRLYASVLDLLMAGLQHSRPRSADSAARPNRRQGNSAADASDHVA
jgi:protein phosphatase